MPHDSHRDGKCGPDCPEKYQKGDHRGEDKRNGIFNKKDWSLYDPMKKPVFSYPWLSADEIAHYSAYGLRQFYLRPGYIVKRLSSIRSLDELVTYCHNFIGFLKRYVLPRYP